MIYFDSEFPRLTVTAKTFKQALYFFKRTYGYSPKEIQTKSESFKGSKFHLKYAYQHEKELR